jgi:tetratricopeptide (TPR) repeat protein
MMIACALTQAFAESEAEATSRQVRIFLEDRVRKDPQDNIALTRLAGEYLRELKVSGDLACIEKATQAARQSLASVPATQNKNALTALGRCLLEQHRFAECRDTALQLLKLSPDAAIGEQLLGDALFELGRYPEASAAFAELEGLDGHGIPSKSRLARVAWFHGDTRTALDLLAQASALAADDGESGLENLAWTELKSGEVCFQSGDFERADDFYQKASGHNPGNWVVNEHIAELRAAQERWPEAVQLFASVIARVRRPEMEQALGDVYAAWGKPLEAAPHWARAREGYLQSIERGELFFRHHLASFYADSEENPPEAIRWAKLDLEGRQSAAAWDALAWAEYKNNDFAAAAETEKKALALGSKEPHVLFHAGMVFLAAGETDRGRQLLKEVALENPRFTSFHVHR